MRYRIAELLVDIPEAGGIAPRCRAYQVEETENTQADIVIDPALYHAEHYSGCNEQMIAYMESGRLFYMELLKHHGIKLHASAVAYQGKAYLFSGPCGTGKSTHTRLWQQVFGAEAQVFNDDKPALRLQDGKWYAYGTPWCGKDGINIDMKVPLAGICFLQQSKENTIRRLSAEEAVVKLLWQSTSYLLTENMDRHISLVDKLVRMIPIYEMENNAQPECAHLSFETMRRGAEEAGL